MNLKEELITWAQKKLTQSTKDPLVNLKDNKDCIDIETHNYFSHKSSFKKLIKKAKDFEKNTGLNSLCLIDKIFVWTYKDEIVHTPLLIRSCSLKLTMLGDDAEVVTKDEGAFVNPFFSSLFNDSTLNSIPEIEEKFNAEHINFHILDTTYLANLHPYRFNIVRELQLLAKKDFSPSPLTQIMGAESAPFSSFNLDEGRIFHEDADQHDVFKKIEKENLVLQGPPGTGKSQTISNLLSKALYSDYKVLMSSEKSVALDIIYTKFKEKELHHFIAFYKGKDYKKEFILQLKSAWEFIENHSNSYTNYIESSEYELQSLDNKIARLQSSTAIGGLSIFQFNTILNNRDLNVGKEDCNLFDLKEYLVTKSKLETLYNNEYLSKNRNWAFISAEVFKSIKGFDEFTKELNSARSKLISTLSKNTTLKELKHRVKLANYIHLFYLNNRALDDELLVPNSKTQKRFYSYYNKLLKFEDDLIVLKEEEEKWHSKLQESELDAFLNFFQEEKGLKFSHFRIKNKLKKMSSLDFSAIPYSLENLKEIKNLERKKNDLKDKLRKNNWPDDLLQLAVLKNTIDRSKSVDENALKEISLLSIGEREKLFNNATKINSILNFWERNFNEQKNEVELVEFIENLELSLHHCRMSLENLKAIDKNTLYAFANYSTIEVLELSVLKTAKNQFKNLNPDLNNFSGKELGEELGKIDLNIEKEIEEFVTTIKDTQKEKFAKLNKLLSTPAYKLSNSQKSLKKEVREGKKILINEFGKTRSHKSLLELLNSGARHWIRCIQPIFLLNTFQVSDSIPLQNGEFDLLVLDEASQIPLTHALGSIFRSNRVLIAGDSQQMSPSNFFLKDSKEADVLHHAAYNFASTNLRHHYRSVHEDLIRFSNQHFYDNKLKVFPNATNKNAVVVTKTLRGIYENNTNTVELIELIDYLEKLIDNGETDLGIVCFNEKQLKLLKSKLSVQLVNYLEKPKHNCFLKTLEKVQGDECKHLIISMTYAPNKDGEFAMRFGPLNKDGGERRLNVLMTRAKERITVFRSFESSDIKISSTPGVEYLKQLMLYLENVNNAKSNISHNSSFIEVSESKKLNINLIKLDEIKARELLTYYKVYKNRNWKVSFSLQ